MSILRFILMFNCCALQAMVVWYLNPLQYRKWAPKQLVRQLFPEVEVLYRINREVIFFVLSHVFPLYVFSTVVLIV